MPRRYKIIITLLVIVVTLGFLAYRLMMPDTQNITVTETSGVDKVDLSAITFLHTDENEGEDLIITSDKKNYQGFSNSTIYFNINPLSKGNEKVGLQFYFTDKNTKVTQIYRYEKEGHYWLAMPLSGGGTKSEKYPQAMAWRKEVEGKTYIQSNTSYDSIGETEYFMAEIAYAPGTQGQFLIEAFGENGSYGILDPWYDSGWDYRKKITVNPEKVSGGHTNFPMLFSRIDLDLRDTTAGGHVASSTGGDILFTDENQNKIAHEIEYYASTTGELIAWVNVPFVSSTSTRDIYIYYGNNTVPLANQENKTGTWNTNYVGVWHLPNGTTLNANDSTSNANNNITNISTTAAEGKVDGGVSFNGSTSRLGYSSPASLDDVRPITGSAWIYETGDGEGGFGYIMSKVPTSLTEGLRFQTLTTLNIQFGAHSTGTGSSPNRASASNTYIRNAWQHVAFTWTGSLTATTILLYVNGKEVTYGGTNNGTTAIASDASNNFIIGNRAGDDRTFNGKIDEVRIASVVLTPDWIATEYNNQSSPNTFYSYSGEGVEVRSSSVAGVKVRGRVEVRGGVKFR